MERFLKCDLHMHSSSCESGRGTESELIEAIVASDLDVVAITDHNIIDTDLIDAIKTRAEIARVNSLPLHLFCGVELNIHLSQELINDRKLILGEVDYFHAILWFDEKEKVEARRKLEDLIHETYPGIDLENTNMRLLSTQLKGKGFDYEDVLTCFKNLNYFFVFHEGKAQERNLSDYLPNRDGQGKLIEPNCNFKSCLFFYNNALAIEGKTPNERHNLSRIFDEELDTVVTRFLFSDTKEAKDVGARFTWINFDGSFSSLILPISDSSSRVFTSEDSPEDPQKKRNYIEAIKFQLQHEGERTIEFNPGFNGIIGSRGSGKSLLASVLASKDLDRYESLIVDSSITYKHSNLQDFNKKAPKVKYLNQGAFEEIFRTGDYMNLDLLSESLKELDNSKKIENQNALSHINDCLKEIGQAATTFFRKYEGKLKRFDILNSEPPASELLTELDSSKYPSVNKEIDSLVKSLEAIIEKEKEQLKDISSLVTPSVIYQESQAISKETSEFLADTSRAKTTEIEKMQNFVNTLSSIDKVGFEHRNRLVSLLAEKFKQNNTESSAQKQTYNRDQEDLIQFLLDIQILRKTISDGFEQIIEQHLVLERPKEIENIRLSTSELLKIQVKCETPKTVGEILQNQFRNGDPKRNLIEAFLYSNEITKFRSYFNGTKFRSINSIEALMDKFVSNLKTDFSVFEDPTPDLFYNGKSLSEFSPGKRSEILLKIFLLPSGSNELDCLILDQPEDNLDTLTISKLLVDQIKNLKLNIQLFIVSHSASVVINGDANHVVIAKEENGAIDYKSGSINENTVKNEIALILDGGEKHIKVRLNKYDFHAQRR